MPSLYQFDFTAPRREKCAVNVALVTPRPNMRATPRHSLDSLGPPRDHLEPKWLRMASLALPAMYMVHQKFIMFPGQLILFKFGLNGLSMLQELQPQGNCVASSTMFHVTACKFAVAGRLGQLRDASAGMQHARRTFKGEMHVLGRWAWCVWHRHC